jgi:alpha-L-rhamnosidase
MAVTIPANTTATVYVPAQAAEDVTVNGKSVRDAEYVSLLKMEEGQAVLKVGSGNYTFESNRPQKPRARRR